METNDIFGFIVISDMFKSYYVVWKPWKKPPNIVYLRWFKSYYVVWKPRYLTSDLGAYQKCLNRTMQYGNLRGNCTHACVYVCV